MSYYTNEEPTTLQPETKDANKQAIEEMRKKKQIIGKYLPEIEKKSQICHLLDENINYEKMKLNETQREIKLSQEKLEKLRVKLGAIKGEGNIEIKDLLKILKTDIINKKIEELLSDKIPEAGLTNYRNKKDQTENEFKNLIHNKVQIIYTIYTSSNTKPQLYSQYFNICKTTKFRELKKAAYNFWGIPKEKEYLLTDDFEAIIYDEEMEVDEFLRSYSVRFQTFRLISTSFLKTRTKLVLAQEDTLEKNNLFESKFKKVLKKSGQESSLHYVNEFTNEFTGLKPYFLKKDENAVEKDLLESKKQARELDTSFIMFALSIIFMSFTIAFIYRGERNSVLNNQRYNNLKTSATLDAPINSNDLLSIINESFFANLKNNQIQKEFIMVVSKVKEKECENSYKNLDKLINAKSQKCFYSKY